MARKTEKIQRGKRGMGSLYKRDKAGKELKADSRKEGNFWLKHRVDGKTKRIPLHDADGAPISSKTDAVALQEKIYHAKKAGETVDQLTAVKVELMQARQEFETAQEELADHLPLIGAWDAYMNSPNRPDSGERTLADYSGYLRRFISWMEEEHQDTKEVRHVSKAIAAEYASDLPCDASADPKKRVSPNTRNKHLGFMKLLFKTLINDEKIKTVNPFANMRRKKLTTDSKRVLTLDELWQILSTANGELASLLGIGTYTGLRLGDCCSLEWSEVDLQRRSITTVPNKTKSTGGKPVCLGIPYALANRLQETPTAERHGYVLPSIAERYFYRNRDSKYSRRQTISAEIQKHLNSCNIRTQKKGTGYEVMTCPDGSEERVYTGRRAVVEVGFHSLRHTFVTLLAGAGTSQAVIQKLVGHGSPVMTQAYVSSTLEIAKMTAAAFPEIDPKKRSDQQRRALPVASIPDIESVKTKLNEMNASNWSTIRDELLEALSVQE